MTKGPQKLLTLAYSMTSRTAENGLFALIKACAAAGSGALGATKVGKRYVFMVKLEDEAAYKRFTSTLAQTPNAVKVLDVHPADAELQPINTVFPQDLLARVISRLSFHPQARQLVEDIADQVTDDTAADVLDSCCLHLEFSVVPNNILHSIEMLKAEYSCQAARALEDAGMLITILEEHTHYPDQPSRWAVHIHGDITSVVELLDELDEMDLSPRGRLIVTSDEDAAEFEEEWEGIAVFSVEIADRLTKTAPAHPTGDFLWMTHKIEWPTKRAAQNAVVRWVGTLLGFAISTGSSIGVTTTSDGRPNEVWIAAPDEGSRTRFSELFERNRIKGSADLIDSSSWPTTELRALEEVFTNATALLKETAIATLSLISSTEPGTDETKN